MYSTLFELGGLKLLGLSAALCLGEVTTTSFEILYAKGVCIKIEHKNYVVC